MPPLTYLSNSTILRYLPFGKRQEMSKKIPSFREANRKIPYRVNKVYIEINFGFILLSLDNSDIKYFFVKGRINRSTPETEYSYADVLPEDIEMRNKYLKKLLKYFFNRPGTSVDYLAVLIFDNTEWCQQNDFNDIQLKIGTLDVSDALSSKQCFMELFKNSHLSKIDFNVDELQDIERIKSFNGSPNVHYNIIEYDSDRIDIQSLIDKLNDNKMRYTLELDDNRFKNFLETLKTSRSCPLGSKVKSTLILTRLSDSQLRNMGGVKSFVTKYSKIKCYTFSTSDPQKEVIVTWRKTFNTAVYYFKAKVQQSGISVKCTPNVTN